MICMGTGSDKKQHVRLYPLKGQNLLMLVGSFFTSEPEEFPLLNLTCLLMLSQTQTININRLVLKYRFDHSFRAGTIILWF